MSVDSSAFLGGEHDALGQHGLYAGKAPNGRNHLSPSLPVTDNYIYM